MKQKPIQFAIIALALLIVMVTACRKQFGATSQNTGSMIDEAESYFKDSIIAKEKEMLATPYEIMPKNSPQRLFARMQKLNARLKWDQALKYNDGGINYVTVPIAGDVKPFKNKTYEAARDLVFYKNESGQMQMKVIELLSTNNASLGKNFESVMRISFINMYNGTNKTSGNVNADVIFYNKDYYREGSYKITDGVPIKSNFGLYNSVSSNKLNISNATIQRIGAGTIKTNSSCGCVTTEAYGVTFDIHTGEIISVDYLGSDTKCNDDGAGADPGYGGGTPPPLLDKCAQDAIDAAQNFSGATVASDTEGFEEIDMPNDPFTKEKNPKWTCLKGTGWILSSQEKGIIKYINYTSDTTLKRWEWKSLEHSSISLTGIPIGGSVEPNSGTGTASVNALIAGMSLSFDVKYSPAYNCPIINIVLAPYTLNYNSTIIGWTAEP